MSLPCTRCRREAVKKEARWIAHFIFVTMTAHFSVRIDEARNTILRKGQSTSILD